jgi:hypothetical protein
VNELALLRYALSQCFCYVTPVLAILAAFHQISPWWVTLPVLPIWYGWVRRGVPRKGLASGSLSLEQSAAQIRVERAREELSKAVSERDATFGTRRRRRRGG